MSKALPMDENNRPIQVARGVVFADGTATPQNSPVAQGEADGITLVTPEGAVALVFRADVLCRWGTTEILDGSAGKGYQRADAGADVVVPTLDHEFIRIVPDDDEDAATVHFHFEVL